jgi:hypothetical protein
MDQSFSAQSWVCQVYSFLRGGSAADHGIDHDVEGFDSVFDLT